MTASGSKFQDSKDDDLPWENWVNEERRWPGLGKSPPTCGINVAICAVFLIGVSDFARPYSSTRASLRKME